MLLKIASVVVLLSTACAIRPQERPGSWVAPTSIPAPVAYQCVPSPSVSIEKIRAEYAYEIAAGIGLKFRDDKLETLKFVNGTELADGVWYGKALDTVGDLAIKLVGAAPEPNPAWACEVIIQVENGTVLVRCARVHTCTVGCIVSRNDYPGGCSYKCWCGE